LILKDKNVSLGGLPYYLVKSNPQIQLELDPDNLYDLKVELSVLLPSFRIAIGEKNVQVFTQDLGKLIVYGLAAFGGAVLISGIVGTFTKSK
jgi:hypothetical protein